MPKPTMGQTLDPKKVNLTFTPPGGTEQILVQSQDCSNADGWHYVPSEVAPSGIKLCANACTKVKAQDQGTISVVLGCANVTR
jgi:hypothetical protein